MPEVLDKAFCILDCHAANVAMGDVHITVWLGDDHAETVLNCANLVGVTVLVAFHRSFLLASDSFASVYVL